MQGEFVAKLPPGYDERTQMTLARGNKVIVTHPEHPPLVLAANGQWVDLNTDPVHPALGSSNC